MNTQLISIAIAALLIGGIGGYAINAQPTHKMPDGSQMHGNSHSAMQGEMDAMMQALEGKTGDVFDKAFLTEMIMHHEGAVVMAQAALENSAREEIRTMAAAIISAQNDEIAQMKGWLQSWYGE